MTTMTKEKLSDYHDKLSAMQDRCEDISSYAEDVSDSISEIGDALIYFEKDQEEIEGIEEIDFHDVKNRIELSFSLLKEGLSKIEAVEKSLFDFRKQLLLDGF